MERRRLVTVPASSANLGPGFDSFAVALSLSMELEVTETGSFAVDTDLAIARDRRNLVVRGFERLHPPDDFSFTIRSEIPLSGGLGTSAAAYLAGLIAADHLFELDADLLALGSELDGHPVEAFDLDHPVQDRQQLPGADAVFNVAHGALLMLGLARGDFELIARGLDDRLHQTYRGPLYPRSYELIARAKEFGALGATLSGAGPTVLAWTTFDTTGGVVEALSAEASDWAQIKRVRFEAGGAHVKEL